MIKNFYTMSTPALFVLMVLELIYCSIKKSQYIEFEDAVSSLSTGIINQFWNIVVLAFAYEVYSFVGHYAFFNIPNTLSSFILAVLLVDFLFYWFHRFGHTYNFMWPMHSPHHTSRQLNYMMAVRTGTFQRFISISFYWPLALLGFSSKWLVLAISFNLVLQFWQHTRVIRKLPRWFEALFNSPTHHRVHHGRQVQYLDKNYAGILIIWDKLFGTYAEEKEEVDYGTLTPLMSDNPHWINLYYFHKIFSIMGQIPGLGNKIKFFFCRLKDVPKWIEKYKIEYQEPTLSRGQKSAIRPNKMIIILNLLICLGLMILATQFPNSVSNKEVFGLFIAVNLLSQWLGVQLNRYRELNDLRSQDPVDKKEFEATA